MAGLEVDSLEPVAEYFTGVVIGKIRRVQKHPAADQLHLCEVGVGQGAVLMIVCGATNVTVGMKAPVALINAVLPNKTVIRETVLRGVTSQGMLCSAFDLGLAEKSEALLELQQEAPEGADFWEYLQLTDYIFDVAVTPNRGDCLSLKGMAREVAAVTQTALKKMTFAPVKPKINDLIPVTIEAKAACPHYVGRIIRGVKAGSQTPLWMQERLRRSGLRSINPLVDVTNYVMLELGQPMHAFDLAKLEQRIVVRWAQPQEDIVLLDGAVVKLDTETLVIADAEKPLAIAGVMGGSYSGIHAQTADLFLESAFFSPTVVARQRQAYQLNSESAFRFERGVDPELQVLAIERATRLLLDIVGGEAGPLIAVQASSVPPLKTVTLRRHFLNNTLGYSAITDKELKAIFKRLGFPCVKAKAEWRVQVPSWRFDVEEEVDLVEEAARLYGYNNISPTRAVSATEASELPENQIGLPRLRRLLCDSGYHEVITYSFVNAQWQALCDPERQAKALVNPITADMTVMRTTLWPGLIGTYLYNRDRQQARLRFFETGLCFRELQGQLTQPPVLGGLLSGSALAEQWGAVTRQVDFYDLKGDIENILRLTGFGQEEFYFKPIIHPALHPGQTAALYRQEQAVGFLGAMHPALRQKFDILETIFLFEFNLNTLLRSPAVTYSEISKFPEIRRDLALVVDRQLSVEEIQATIVANGGEWLRQVTVFDVYLGEGVPKDKKSVAFALTLQHATRTLRDEEVVETMERIMRALQQTWGIELRG
jgi:phenylalanyl-tRNA synthetase beta chain